MGSGEENEEPGKRRDRHQRAAAAGAGAAVGAIIAGPAGAVVGAALGPLIEPFAVKVWEEVSADGRRRGADVLATACEASQRPIEEILELIDTSDRMRLLAGIAMSAATRTAWQAKVRTLGQSLASGLLAKDDAQIDTEQLIIAAIADIEGPHLSLLDLLVSYQPTVTLGVGWSLSLIGFRHTPTPSPQGSAVWLVRGTSASGFGRPCTSAWLARRSVPSCQASSARFSGTAWPCRTTMSPRPFRSTRRNLSRRPRGGSHGQTAATLVSRLCPECHLRP